MKCRETSQSSVESITGSGAKEGLDSEKADVDFEARRVLRTRYYMLVLRELFDIIDKYTSQTILVTFTVAYLGMKPQLLPNSVAY